MLHTQRTTVTVLISLALAGFALAAEPSPMKPITPEIVLKQLKREHPRVMVTEADFDRIRKLVETNERAKRIFVKVRQRADGILDDRVAEYEIPDGKRLLFTSRKVLDRTRNLAMAYRVTDEAKYRERLLAEMQAVAAFKDWNPSHFLDTGEMMLAVAIAYDWLYHDWTDEQRAVMRDAIVTHGLGPARKSYRGEARYGWWTTSHHNWNQVCNGGVIAGALAVADDEPELAAEMVTEAVKSLPRAMHTYAPDGGWFEGPAYWAYATRYNVFAMAALETALGEDFGLGEHEGFDVCVEFPLYMRGPTGLTYNFADCRQSPVSDPTINYLAHRYDRPAFAWYRELDGRTGPGDLLWFYENGEGFAPTSLPLDRLFIAVQVATMRSSWTEADAIFVGMKAGKADINHSNLDLGSFVIEALGERWAVDMGGDDYNLPAYFGGRRWTYYRLRAEGHNTLVINPGEGADQNVDSTVKFTEFKPDATSPSAEIDLTEAYVKHGAESVTRRFELVEREKLVITDTIKLAEPGDVWWFMHTPAKAQVADDGREATLTIEGKRLRVRLLAGSAGKLTVMDAEPLPTSPNPDGQNENEGIRKLAIHVGGEASVVLTVELTPLK